MSITDELLQMKEQKERASKDRARIEGQIEMKEKELFDQWGCTTIREAETVLAKMKANNEKKEAELLLGIQELRDKHKWE